MSPLEVVDQVAWQCIVEISRDAEDALIETELPASYRSNRHEPRDRPAVAGDDDLFARSDAAEHP
jgi:hypothetical protein